MKYTSRDLIRAYREKSHYGSITRNARLMGISASALKSLVNSLDRISSKGMHATTRKAWEKIHHMGETEVLTVEEHLEKIDTARAVVAPIKSLDASWSDFRDDVALFIERAVESDSKKQLEEKDTLIAELERKIDDLKFIAEVAKKENRFAQLTKKFFHED